MHHGHKRAQPGACPQEGAGVPLTSGRHGHARVALLSVIEEETRAVQTVLGLTQRVPGLPYFVAPGADLSRPAVVNREVGRTNLQAGICIRDVIEHWRAEALILCGIAGGIPEREQVQLGDLVVPEYVHYCSFAKLSENGQQRRYIAYDHPSLSLHSYYAAPLRDDKSWITSGIDRLLPNQRLPKVLIGSLVAGDKVYGNPTSEEQHQIIRDFDDAIAIDMESVRLCRAVADARRYTFYNPRLLIIRSISDMIGEAANNEQRAQYKDAAATIAATFAKHVVQDILAHEPDPRPTGDAGD